MSKKRFVFFICICIIVMAVFAFSYIRAYNLVISKRFLDEEENTENVNEITVNVTEEPYYDFVIKEENGYVTVYEYPDNTLYHNTGILTISLDKKIRLELENGIYIKDINELFDLLESYSS